MPKVREAILQGALFGLAAIVGMARPLVMGPGLIFDGRSVMICLGSLFFGPIAAVTAGGLAAVFRMTLGGVGLPMGLLVILESALLGLAFRWWRQSRGGGLSVWTLLGLGVLVHAVMLLLLITLPDGSGLAMLKRVGLSVLLVFPVATVVVGKVLQGQEAEDLAREALRESEGHFRSLAESSPDAIVRLDPAFRHTYLNPEAIRISGLAESALLLKTHRESGCPEAIFRLWEERAGQVFATAMPAQAEFEWPGADGTVLLDLRLTPELNAEGQVSSVLGVSRDITHLRRTETTVRKILAAVEHCSVAVVITDSAGIIEYVNPKFTAITGYTQAEILGQNPRILKSGECSPDTYQALWSTILGGQEWRGEFHNRKKNGELFWEQASISPIRDGQGAISHFVAVKEDITERKRTEALLLEREAQNGALLSAIPDLIFINHRDGEFLAVHASNPELLLMPPELVLHRKTIDLLPPPLGDRLMAAYGLALETKRCHEVDYVLVLNGEDRFFEARIAPYGEDTVVSMIRDVTERRKAQVEGSRLQAQLAQAQKMESLGSLAGGVAHDMNNVLGAILGLASLQLAGQPQDSVIRESFETILRAAERGGQMVQGLLGFARQAPAEERDLDLNALLQEVMRLLERTTLAKVRLSLAFEQSLNMVRGDASALSHAFMNLCVNAVDAMPEGGELTLRTRNGADGAVEVEVHDTGCGMPPAILERALDPFFTTKEQGRGTGLGLSMVYTTVKAHQGHLELQSMPGSGTCVRLQFPGHIRRTEPMEPLEHPGSGSRQRGLKVLVVDDDELIRISNNMLLVFLGHTVTTLASGEEAIAWLEAGERPDLVIIDMNMPGLGGAGSLPRIRALHPTLPILLATGRVDQSALDLMDAHPTVGLLAKPFTLEELRDKLGQFSL